MRFQTQQKFEQAFKLHQRGMLGQAGTLYKEIIELEPEHFDAIHMSGVVAYSGGHLDEAESLLARALALKSDSAPALSNYGLVLTALQRHDDALLVFNRAAAINPRDPILYFNRGVNLQEMEKFNDALSSYDRAINIRTNYADAFCNKGQVLHQLGRYEESLANSNKAIAIEPQYAEAYNNRGNALLGLKRYNEALASYDKAIAINPNYAEAFSNRGVALEELERDGEAIASYERAIAIKPGYTDEHSPRLKALLDLKNIDEEIARLGGEDHHKTERAELLNSRGLIQRFLNRKDEALESYEMASSMDANYLPAYKNQGKLLQDLERHAEALSIFQKANSIAPNDIDILASQGSVLLSMERFGEAIEVAERAISSSPDNIAALMCRASVLCKMLRFDDAFACYDKVLAIQPDYLSAYAGKLFNMNYVAKLAKKEIFKAHQLFGTQFGGKSRKIAEKAPLQIQSTIRKIRIGYVSGDFRSHSVSFFASPLLRHHDKEKFEIFCYYNDDVTDQQTIKMRGFSDRWRKIKGKDDLRVSEMIMKDRIDILVDLSGHTGHNRLTLFGLKPAPIQVTWLGYPNTTGMCEIDFRLTDVFADPVGIDDEFYTEKLVRLPRTFLCYEGDPKLSNKPDIPFKKNGFVTFGSFNNSMKISDITINAWARILKGVPGSKLLLKTSIKNDSNDQLLSMFAQNGINEDRIILQGRLEGYADHLNLYGEIDIALDTFPYNGTTTTCEALWMGVPVVAFSGDRHASRVSASILNNVGLPNFVADDVSGYVDLAIKMSKDMPYIGSLRKSLRKKMASSNLCNAKAFATDIEAAYEQMYAQLNSASEGAAPG